MGRAGKLGGALLALLLVAIVAVTIRAPQGCQSNGSGNGGVLSATGREEIPQAAARMYLAMAERWSIDVAFLAAIGAQECDHGRCGGLRQVNYAGCVGWMQLGVGGKCGTFWNRNRCDGNHDGRTDVLDSWDNICAAARGLRKEKGAPATGGSAAAYRAAAGRYYGGCSGNGVAYCDEVMARAKRYGFHSTQRTVVLASVSHDEATSDQCEAPDGDMQLDELDDGPDKPFTVLPAANRPGGDLTPRLIAAVRQIASRLPRRLKVCTGSNHNRLTTSGNVSDHWSGNAVDLCSSANGFPASGGGYGDTIAAAALMAAGKERTVAVRIAKHGGAYTIYNRGLRWQIIWKSLVGGNHYNHVHVGIQRVLARAARTSLPKKDPDRDRRRIQFSDAPAASCRLGGQPAGRCRVVPGAAGAPAQQRPGHPARPSGGDRRSGRQLRSDLGTSSGGRHGLEPVSSSGLALRPTRRTGGGPAAGASRRMDRIERGSRATCRSVVPIRPGAARPGVGVVRTDVQLPSRPDQPIINSARSMTGNALQTADGRSTTISTYCRTVHRLSVDPIPIYG